MPLDASQANTKTEAVNAAFAAIGTGGATGMPASRKNTETLAYEYHVASHLKRIAETRRDRAHKAAVKAGIIFDHEKEPRPVGTDALVYSGDVVEISVAVAAPVERLDAEAVLAELVAKHGVKQATVARLITKHTQKQRAPHKFTSSLITG